MKLLKKFAVCDKFKSGSGKSFPYQKSMRANY